MNFSIAIDNKMAAYWESLAPHRNVFEMDRPRQISGNISMPKPPIATFSNFLNSDKGYNFTPEQIARFNALPDA